MLFQLEGACSSNLRSLGEIATSSGVVDRFYTFTRDVGVTFSSLLLLHLVNVRTLTLVLVVFQQKTPNPNPTLNVCLVHL